MLEDCHVCLRDNVVEVIQTLDRRGILQSIASRNNYDHAMDQLRRFGLAEYFLYPQINWGSKAASLKTIASSINIGLDAVAFIDDQEFEGDERAFLVAGASSIAPVRLESLRARPNMNPRLMPTDSRLRRLMYISDLERKKAEESSIGSQEEFLATVKVDLKLGPAKPEDLH